MGVYLDQELTWQEHITNLLSSCYGALAVLRKLKNFSPYHIRKLLVESLILSKLNYCNVVFSPLPEYQTKHLQRVQNTCAGFVLTKFAGLQDVRKLGWLTIKERLEFNIAKLAHKSLYNKDFPLKLKQHVVNRYSLRSLAAPKLELANKIEKNTLQDQAAEAFNKLPAELRNCSDHALFCLNLKRHILTCNG